MKEDIRNYKFSPEEAAAYLGYKPSTLANMRWCGTGPKYYKPSGKVFYFRNDLDDWIKNGETMNKSGWEMHNIEHMSPSSLNMFADCAGAWLAKYRFGHKFKFGVAPQIGILVEKVVANALLERLSLDEAIDQAEKEFNRKNALGASEKDRERVVDIRAMSQLAYDALKEYGKPEFDGENQKKIELLCKGDGWELPVIGYLDFDYPQHGFWVDLKTTLRIPSTMSDGHRRQEAIYKKAKGNAAGKFLYVSPKKISMLENEDSGESLRQVKAILNRQERFLRLGDAETLKSFVPVNAASFYWNNEESALLNTTEFDR